MSHHDIARAIQAIVDVDLPWSVEDALEAVAFEEWDAFFNFMMERRRESATTILECIASRHHDDGWVFNAARILDEFGALRGPVRSRLLRTGDPDLRELLGDDDPDS